MADSHLAEKLLASVFPDKFYFLLGKREYGTIDVQELAHVIGRLGETALQVNERCQHDVAHRVIVEAAVFGEAVSQQFDKIFVHIGHGDQDLTHISHGRDVKLLFQNTGTAAVVTDRDHCRHVYRKLLQT